MISTEKKFHPSPALDTINHNLLFKNLKNGYLNQKIKKKLTYDFSNFIFYLIDFLKYWVLFLYNIKK